MQRTWNTVTEALQEKLVESGKTYYELSEETGVVRSSLIRFLNGNTGLQSATIDKLLQHYRLKIVEARAKPKRRR
jgi:plasmid maintenance system antidote protein VapI